METLPPLPCGLRAISLGSFHCFPDTYLPFSSAITIHSRWFTPVLTRSHLKAIVLISALSSSFHNLFKKILFKMHLKLSFPCIYYYITPHVTSRCTVKAATAKVNVLCVKRGCCILITNKSVHMPAATAITAHVLWCSMLSSN